MADRTEPVALRNKRLFRSVICRSGPMQRSTGMKMTQDALLDAFILLFDECSKESLKRDVAVANFINKYRSLVTEIKSLRVSLDDFALEAVIGRGHFGEVRVVREKETQDIFAMKILEKSKTIGRDTAALFEEEHDIMCLNNSPWLTSLQYSFQDSEHLYFVMDFHPGGDLLSLLDRYSGTFTPEMTKFYLAEIALAVKALHQMGYVHRDLKPDNILLDRCGHVKLADFGSAARLTASGFVSQSMPVGTPEYVAPEILLSLNNECSEKRKKFYGVECDYWSLGILAYEMIVGCTPFSGNELKITYFNIMNHKTLKFPENSKVPESLQDLINKLLEDPGLRLKHEGLIKHPFFIDIDWSNIRNEAPPFVPSLKSPSDTSNFLESDKKKLSIKLTAKESRKEFCGKHLPFIGFTFSNDTETTSEQIGNKDSSIDQKASCLESVLARVRRENQNLMSKLCEAEFGKTNELEKVEKLLQEKSKLFTISEAERKRLMRESAKFQAENANLKRTLEMERKDRKDMEMNALNLIRQNKLKSDREMSNLVSQLNSKIEELNDKLTESHTVNNELVSKYDRTENELTAAKNEIERLKSLEVTYKDKMAKAREMKRQSFVGLESRIEQLANENYSQSNILQQKLNEEVLAKNEVLDRMKEMETVWSVKESQLKEEIKEYEDKIQKLQTKISVQHSEIASLQVKLEEKPNVVLLEQRLEAEKTECAQLRSRIAHMEAELTNTTNSFLDHESAIAAHEENMCALEKEFRQISEEKIQLQKKLQKTKEIEEENRQKLSSLEVVVDRLEEGVVNLEAENAKLKQQLVAYSQPITCEAETRYQEKITILEDQIAKLENQLQKLREAAVLEKESLKTIQSTLWKTEKELSNAKIDIRIAKRETKAAESTVTKLNEELKKMTEKLNSMSERCSIEVAAEREKFDSLSSEITKLKSELGEREWENKMLKNQLEDFEELKLTNKELKKDHNEVCQNYKILEKQLVTLKEEKESLKEAYQNLEIAKMKVESVVEDMKHKMCSLELNNTVLKETGAMMDEQLEGYERFTVNQKTKIEQLMEEKSTLESEIESVRGELRASRQNLNEEKSLRLKAEQRVSFLENEIANAEDSLSAVQAQLAASCNVSEELKIQVKEFEEKVANYELEIQEWKRMYNALEGECQWLKQETTTHLTNLYSLRESNYKLTHNLEEEQQLVIALQERITELQTVITELEAFHKQREVKDEATKQQQNKLISFLQTKLDDAKKKKTLSDVLFGSRTKENFPPGNGGWTSPKSCKTLPDVAKNKTMRDEITSPSKKRILSEIVKSPASQSPFQRQASLQRMHHNIPHRFKNQLAIMRVDCYSCHSGIKRGSQVSVCAHCGIQTHPKCSVTVPKTCGLPDGFAKHYAKSISNHAVPENPKPTTANVIHEGWIKVPKLESCTWQKKFGRLDGTNLLIFEHEPRDTQQCPIEKWNLCPKNNQIVVGEITEIAGLPITAKSDVPYIIKIAVVPENSCWPKEIHHMMVLTPADKPVWLAALNEVITKDLPIEKMEYRGDKIVTFAEGKSLHVNAVSQINDRLLLLAAEEGLYSLRGNSENSEPTKIEGVTKVKQISVAPQIGLVLMICEEDDIIVETDYRGLVSNAEALSCVSPRITAEPVSLGSAVESCLMFSLSEKIDGVTYLTAATPTRLILLKWNIKDSQFLVSRVLETLHPCNCILYTSDSVIVGCDKFFTISLQDFSIQEFLDPTVTSLAFWRIGSFPIDIFEVGPTEFLLCYNEFGVFVNERGEKIQSDLKWNKAPTQFAFRKPYLFVIHKTSLEVVLLPRPDQVRSNEDTISTASTATIQDSVHVSFNDPFYLGNSKSKGGVFIKDTASSGKVDLILFEGKKLYKNDLGSCISLTTVTDENPKGILGGDEFSFTSSTVHSLYEIGCSTPHPSDESDSCQTYTVTESEKLCSSKKVVSFIQHTSM